MIPTRWSDHLGKVARNITFIKGDVLEGLEDLTMDKGADQKLDFTYIEDAARGTAMLYQAKAVRHNIYNIATRVPTRVGRVAELCRQYSNLDENI